MLQGYYITQTIHYEGEIPQIFHATALFDFPKIGNLIDPCIKCTNKKSSKTTAQVAILLTSQTAAILLGRNPWGIGVLRGAYPRQKATNGWTWGLGQELKKRNEDGQL